MRRGNAWGWWIVAAAVLALGVRWLVLARWYWDLELAAPNTINDNLFYHRAANLLADGEGFVNPFSFDQGIVEPTAAHPPGYTVVLAFFSFFGLDSVGWHRIVSGLVSASVVVPVGLLVRRVANDRAAVLAMGLAAVHPPLWMNDGLLLSESLAIPLAAWALYAAQRVFEEPSMARVLGLSAVLALGALTRSETVLLYVILLTPLVGLHRDLQWRDRLVRVGAAALLAVALLSPWVVRNLATFDEPTYLAVGAGYVIEIGNCDLTYEGDFLGYWHAGCDDGSAWPDGDESVIGAAKLERGRAYISDHLDQQPKVVAARVGRLFGFFRPGQGNDFDVFFERRVRAHVEVGLLAHYGVMAAAVVGAVVWRRRASLIGPAALIAAAAIAAATAFGISRYRVGADVALVVLAAVGVDAILRHLGPRLSAASAVVDDADPVEEVV